MQNKTSHRLSARLAPFLAAGAIAIAALSLGETTPAQAATATAKPAALVATQGTPAGDYVEARTASVFAGACHYGGEYESDGREAIMAWHFAKGVANGVSLAGLTAIAVVRSDQNLAEAKGRHHTFLYVDSQATPTAQQALTTALETRYAGVFGTVASVQPATISFTRTASDNFRVNAPQVAVLTINALPNRECCKMPNLVWYKPLATISDRRVGFTQLASCTKETGGDAWSRGNENSAFYGTFQW